ncbi:uncharacterized protein [Antedon mediterranea]|uniref:uncharacterized protein n=1 Tax=Antedon mediterranea TaxID=105859 RepID=UPI003AF95614
MFVSTTASQVSKNTLNEEVAAQQKTCTEERLFSRYCDEKRLKYEGIKYQENMIAKNCEKIYTKWKRMSSSGKSFSDLSRDGKFTIGYIGKEGGHLKLRNGDIQLYIPPGAMADVAEGYVFMYADSVHYNLVKYDVIICGPPGLQFNNSVLLRFPNPKSQDDALPERPSVKLSVQELGKPLEWRSLDTTTDGSFFLEDGNILLHLNHFTGIKVDVGVQAEQIPTTAPDQGNLIFLSTFLEHEDGRYFSFRVHCSTYSALEDVNKDELGSKQIGKPVKMGSFRKQDEITITIMNCVDCKVEPSDYSICVSEVVSDVDNHIHRQFVLECSSNLAFLKFQVNVGGKTVHMARVKVEPDKAPTAVNKLYLQDEVEEFHDEYQESEFTPSPLSRPILTTKMRRELSMQLDMPRIVQWKGESNARYCDYRGLAELMGMSKEFIDWIRAPKNCLKSSSPTILLLNKWEIECSKRQLVTSDALNELKQYLIKLGQHFCIEIIEGNIPGNKYNFRPSKRRKEIVADNNPPQRRWSAVL